MNKYICILFFFFPLVSLFPQDAWKAEKLFNEGKYDSVVLYLGPLLPLEAEQFGVQDTVYYTNHLIMLATSLQKISNLTMAEKYLTDARMVYEKNGWMQSPRYGEALNLLGMNYLMKGQYEKAEEVYKNYDRFLLRYIGDTGIPYAVFLDNYGLTLSRMGSFEKSERCFLQALRIIKDSYGDESGEYGNVLHNLSQMYSIKGDFENAESGFLRAIEIEQEVNGEETATYSVMISSLAQLYGKSGRFQEAEAMYIKSVEVIRRQPGYQRQNCATQLNNLASLYRRTGQYGKSEPLFLEALQLDKETGGENSADYSRDLNNLGILYRAVKDYDKALSYLRKAAEISKSLYGTNSLTLSVNLLNIASVYAEKGARDSLLLALDQSAAIRKQSGQQENINGATQLINMAWLYYSAGYTNTADSLFHLVFNIFQQHLENNAGFLSAIELEKLVGMYLSNLDGFQLFNTRTNAPSSSSAEFAYDIELMRKSILLRSALMIRNSIMESGDSALLDLYDDLSILKRRINKISAGTSAKSRALLPELENMANELEKQITLKSEYYRNLRPEGRTTWQDIREYLQPDEAAIEFFTTSGWSETGAKDSMIYYAVLLRKTDTTPLIIRLFDEKELIETNAFSKDIRKVNSAYTVTRRSDSRTTNGKNLFTLIWKPLDSRLSGIRTIYYAPSGLLHRISFSAIPSGVSGYLADHYQLIPVSSTRLLTGPRDKIALQNAVIFGGINYDTDTLSFAADNQTVKLSGSGNIAYGHWASRDFRSGFRYLPESKKEVEQVAEKLTSNGISVKLYEGGEAKEETFAGLSGFDSPTLIHIATHGFYFPDSLDKKNVSNQLFKNPDDVLFKESDDPLLRSGLLLTGGNSGWKGVTRPGDSEDGVLTAKEVSGMSLDKTKVVVLSACQTGLGDVKGSEGVEGLHRAFKMAGVRMIIMSLWSVPDKESAEFMETFYDQWLSGKEIHAAFRSTQMKMRHKHPDFPIKWAGFEMIE